MSERIQKELDKLRSMGYGVNVVAVDFFMSGDEGLSGLRVHMEESTLLEQDKRVAERQRKKLTVVKT